MLTPAEDVRRAYKTKGWKSLSLEEQQWCIMDQAYRPEKYEWLREREEEINAERIRRGKKPKTQRYKRAVEQFRITKLELDHLLVQPFAALTKHEMIVRKLMRKYHDDPEVSPLLSSLLSSLLIPLIDPSSSGAKEEDAEHGIWLRPPYRRAY